MSDTTTLDDEPELDDDGNPVEPEPKPDKAERNAEKLRKARLTEAELRKELAFAKAGVDVESTFGKYLLSTFTGEATKEAIEAHATAARKELGLPEPEAPATTPEGETTEPEKTGPTITPEMAASTAERREAAGESVPDDGSGITPKAQARQAFDAVMASGGTKDAAGAAFIRTLREAAEAGDTRAMVAPVPRD